MNDKDSIKSDPKHAIFIQIGDTLPDILPLLQRGLQGIKSPKMTPKRCKKYAYLSTSVFGEKRIKRHAENEQETKIRVVFLSEWLITADIFT